MVYHLFMSVLLFVIQLSRGEWGWYIINWLSLATCLYLYQLRPWIPNVISRNPFVFNDLMSEVAVGFIDIGGIGDHY